MKICAITICVRFLDYMMYNCFLPFTVAVALWLLVIGGDMFTKLVGGNTFVNTWFGLVGLAVFFSNIGE